MLMLAQTAQAADAWEPIEQGQGRESISTWVRPVEGQAVKAFRGVTEVHEPPLVVLALLADTRNLANWVFHGQFSDHPPGMSGNLIYMRFNGVWPSADRDVMFRTTVTRQGEVVVIDSRSTEGYPVNVNYVRMPLLHNTFRLTPLKGGWTRVEFETVVDLGGLVPTWIANLVSTKAPLVTLQGLREQLKNPKYQIHSEDELPHDYQDPGSLDKPADRPKAAAP